ncbi:MAG TPA: Crp/Fnr family transcriptional regulator [Pyrinomonadaceae bacterium]|nr:Crp/Fnr family transcriptional regulator [Pyrinomonadaceae bacterium]
MQELDENSVARLLPDLASSGASLIPEVRLQEPIAFSGVLANRLLASLPGPDLSRLLPYLHPVSLTDGEDILRSGEAADSVYFPESAVISHLHLLEDGSTTAATIIGNEGMVGLSSILDARPAAYSSHVTVGGRATRVATNVIQKEFARGGALQRIILAYAHARLTQLSQQAVCNGRHLMFGRLCTWLLMVHERAVDQPLRLTHERIAQHLGARRAGITSACKQLRAESVITYQRGLIVVSDQPRLATLACECYAMLQSLSA